MTSLAQRTQHAWPDGARCVIGLTLDFDGTSLERGRDQLPFGARSHGRYSAKCGIPRFVDMFTRQEVPWTFYVSGYDAEESPDLVRSIARSGIEIGSHGYLHEGVDPGDAEPELLERTHKLLSDITGTAPKGWRSPSGHKTARTLHKLRELGYVYDSSDKDFDLPYLLRYGGQEHDNYLCLPNNTSSLDDFPFYRVSYTPPSEVLTHWMQEFDAIYAEGGYFNLTVHPRVGR
jgi:peptidoglycan/xylan/chitin deacetylase (PgdA/CDA1 family)